jgi:hypothetical protein
MFLLAVSCCLSLATQSFPQTQREPFSRGLRLKPGARIEYFSRSVTWGNEEYETNLKATIMALNLEIEINDGFSVHALAGYVLSDYDVLTFRQIPFSVELDTGNTGGFILGAEIIKSLYDSGRFQIGLLGQFTHHLGKEKTWDIPGLNVTGSVTEKPIWMRGSAGVYIKFMGHESLSPYIAICYNNLWGKIEIKQTIENLKGTEEKELQCKGLLDITMGSTLSLRDNIFLRGEAHALPYGDGIDLGFVAIAAFSF